MNKGIDVSEHQGRINWPAVKAGGIAFALIRVGWTHYEGGLTIDDRFDENMAGAIAAGLPVGAYAYGYDLSAKAGRISAAKVMEAVKPYRLEYPLYYDQEYEAKILALSMRERTEICKAFMDTVQGAEFYTGLYASRDWLETKLIGGELVGYDKWVAAYRSDLPVVTTQTSGYAGSHGVWQYTVIGGQGVKGKDYWTSGAVAGVAGNCDVNVAYKDYPGIIRRTGLNGWGKPGGGEGEDAGDAEKPEMITVTMQEWEALQGRCGVAERELARIREMYEGLRDGIVGLAERCKE